MATCQEKQAKSAQTHAITAQGGAVAGAAVGTYIFPGIGTAIGGAIGGLAGLFGGHKKCTPPPDPTNLYNAAIADYQNQLDGLTKSLADSYAKLQAQQSAANARAQVQAVQAKQIQQAKTVQYAMIGAGVLAVVFLLKKAG